MDEAVGVFVARVLYHGLRLLCGCLVRQGKKAGRLYTNPLDILLHKLHIYGTEELIYVIFAKPFGTS